MGNFCGMNRDGKVQSNKGNERRQYQLIDLFNSSYTIDQNDKSP